MVSGHPPASRTIFFYISEKMCAFYMIFKSHASDTLSTFLLPKKSVVV